MQSPICLFLFGNRNRSDDYLSLRIETPTIKGIWCYFSSLYPMYITFLLSTPASRIEREWERTRRLGADGQGRSTANTARTRTHGESNTASTAARRHADQSGPGFADGCLLGSHSQIVNAAVDLEVGSRRRARERTRQVHDRACDLVRCHHPPRGLPRVERCAFCDRIIELLQHPADEWRVDGARAHAVDADTLTSVAIAKVSASTAPFDAP